MDRSELTRIQGWSILGGAALMLSLAMGMRQSLGLFQPQMIRDIGVTAAQFSFAIAIQNIVWGLTQPFVGMAADRWGARPIAVGGVLLYAGGIALAIVAHSALGADARHRHLRRHRALLHRVEHRDERDLAHRRAGTAQRRDGRGLGVRLDRPDARVAARARRC